MALVATCLGFPRIGADRELKKALESFWAGKITGAALEEVGRGLRIRHWSMMKEAGIREVPTNDFSLYDHVLDAAVMLGAIPPRYTAVADPLSRYFAMARGLQLERTDMVEYFGEQLEGFAFTRNGWVQSYGSRCVKPPVIFGDVARPRAMTVEWTRFAQSLTRKPMKGMLTGPVTILQWSFVRDDQPRAETCRQIALALRDEVADLEAAGVGMIQVDEPAIREGLPLRRIDHEAYLRWAVDAFRLATAGVRDATQIHTHMCYSEFGDVLEAIAALDADVLSIETSRSKMELFHDFGRIAYPNEVGPGVYDIHSPRVPTVEEIADLLARAARVVPVDRLWVNPDCGLKTRGWPEVRAALDNMVEAARRTRRALSRETG